MRASTRRAVWQAASVVNGMVPGKRDRLTTTPAFFGAWITTEATGPQLLLNALGAWGTVRRGELRTWEGRAALGLRALAAVGQLRFIRHAFRTDDQFEAALAPWIGEEDLAARPSSVRHGAWVPFVYGGRHRRHRVRNVVFHELEGRPKLELDVYGPLTEGTKRPAVVQVHGGAWILGDKREQGIVLLNHLAANGWVGFNVNYSLSPRTRAPEHLIDIKRAIAWIREHADEYGVDPDFICVTGGSAGGHLCALLALTANDPEYQPGFEDADTSVQAAVPFYGAYDLVDEDHHMVAGFRETFVEPILFGARYHENAEPFIRYSPIMRCHPDAPPMMIVHGSHDSLVPVQVGRNFARRLAEVSRSAVIWVELEGAQHAFEVFPSPRTVRAVEYVERFLDAVHRGVIK